MSEEITVQIAVPAPSPSEFYDVIGTSVAHFQITPSMSQNWETKIKRSDGEFFPFDALNIEFQLGEDLTALEHEQSVILIADIDNSADPDSIWHFHQDGVVFTSPICADECQVTTEVINQGTQLIMEISKVDTAPGTKIDLAFVYNAIRFNKNSPSEPKVYYSQDPRVGIGRPKIPVE